MNDGNSKVERHKRLCDMLNDIYRRKNHDYGDSFHDTFVDEGLAMARIRLSDKLNRFKKLSKLKEDAQNQEVRDESMRDTLLDLANYAIMTVMEMDIQDEEDYHRIKDTIKAEPLKMDGCCTGLDGWECPICHSTNKEIDAIAEYTQVRCKDCGFWTTYFNNGNAKKSADASVSDIRDCPSCGTYMEEMQGQKGHVCPKCGYQIRMDAVN